MHRPHIVYIHSHDTGRYISPYGHAIATPNLQAFAEQGITFRHAFCAGPTCSPSRAALLTGQSPHSAGMLGLAHRGFQLNDYNQHLCHTLKANGYRTVLAGFQHVGDFRENGSGDPHREQGYDEVHDWRGESARTVAFARDQIARAAKDEQPMFLDVGFTATHRKGEGFDPPPGPKCTDPRYVAVPAPLPDTPDMRQDMAEYIDAARHLDTTIGQVLGALEEFDLASQTMVIITTDHGIAFPLMKCNCTVHGAGVMLMMRGPEGACCNGGKVSDALVSQVDIFPTICDMLGIDRPAWLQGNSLRPIFRGEAKQINEQIYHEVTYHASYEPMRAVRTHRYCYIKRFGDKHTPTLPNIDNSLTKTELYAQGLVDKPLATEQLYDCFHDPQEMSNLADDPAYASVLDDLNNRLDRWMQATDDPLLSGEQPIVAGMEVSDSEGYAPNDGVKRY